jgi:prophage regulatory protein
MLSLSISEATMTKHQLDEILRIGEVCKSRKISRTTLWRLVKAGKFPPPVKITPSISGFFRSDLVRHQAELRAAAGLPDTNSE